MGKRGRRKAQYDSDESYTEDYDSSTTEEELDSPISWLELVDETDNISLDVIREYNRIDYRFKWMQLYVILEILENLCTLHRGTYPNYPYIHDPILEDYANDVYYLYDMENKPISYYNENDEYIPFKPVERKKCIQYIVYHLNKHLGDYFYQNIQQPSCPPLVNLI